MKIFIDCDCVITQKTLEIFLKDFMVDEKDADFVVTDEAGVYDIPIFLVSPISPYLNVPFSKNELMETLKKFYLENVIGKKQDLIINKSNYKNNMIIDEISELFDEFKDRLISILSKDRNG